MLKDCQGPRSDAYVQNVVDMTEMGARTGRASAARSGGLGALEACSWTSFSCPHTLSHSKPVHATTQMQAINHHSQARW